MTTWLNAPFRLAFEPVWWRLAGQASLVAIDLPGHFTGEDAADEYAALVTGWWRASHGQRGPGRRSTT